MLGKRKELLNQERERRLFVKTSLAWLALCAAPLLVQAQENCTSPNSNDDYILGDISGTASAMHWESGLVWKRCSQGQVFNAGQCTGTAQQKNWHTWAVTYLPQPFTGQENWGISTSVSENRIWTPRISQALTHCCQEGKDCTRISGLAVAGATVPDGIRW